MQVFIFFLLFIFIANHSAFAQDVLINEFKIDPQPQSVELFNLTDNIIDISGWYIDDNGGSTFFTIPNDTLIFPHSCVLFSADFNLNKSTSDTVRLFNKDAPPTSVSATLVDSFVYPRSAGENIAFSRFPDGDTDWASGEASLGRYNVSKELCEIKPTPLPNPTPSETPIAVSLTPTPSPIATPTIYQEQTSFVSISEAMVYPEEGVE